MSPAAYAMAIDWATDLSAMAVEEANPTLKDAMRGVANATAKAESVRKYLLVRGAHPLVVTAAGSYTHNPCSLHRWTA